MTATAPLPDGRAAPHAGPARRPMAAAELRRALLELRGQALDALLRNGIDPEMLAVLGAATAALDALDRLPNAASPVSRAIVANDADGLRLILFDQKARGASISLDPAAAISLAGDLLKAAELRRQIDGNRNPEEPARRRARVTK